VRVGRVAALTFGAYSEQWLRERALKPRTREANEHLLGRYLMPALGRMPIDTITPSVVRTWWSRLPADGACSQLRVAQGGHEHGGG
jgi:Phage integrase, N-terminal SAM-like domain